MGFEITGNRLKQLREELGKTQKEFAAMIEADQGRYSKWERGENIPSYKYARRILEIAADPGSQVAADISNSRRKSQNLSIQASLLSEAKALGVNVSNVAEEAIASAVSAEKNRRWKEENREAIESSNAYFEEHGLPFAKYRMF